MIPCKIFASRSPYSVNGEVIFRACDRRYVGTMTLSKYFAEYEQIRKPMVKFLFTSQGRSIKIVSYTRVDKP